jgi:hypothetical protein
MPTAQLELNKDVFKILSLQLLVLQCIILPDNYSLLLPVDLFIASK